ncbi:uncharacterized protein golgb1 [Genypterus blacodes]|uniref:uncharacterized protein golgb1 n=1 Tax=Genypterus blacodes TaxID=154954 RepID=UPI003F767AAB
MFSRLATVLQELSGEEGQDGDPQDILVPQIPGGEAQVLAESEEATVSEDTMERLAHLEQLVVQLKGLIQDKDLQLVQKDTELANRDTQLQNEKETADARFTKLKMQAKAKMASLNKQITDLKGQEGATSPESSFTTAGAAVEEELQEVWSKLSEEEANSRELKERLQVTQQLLQEKESMHSEQLRVLQAVVCEKDVRFQEQVQKHEEELLEITTQSQNDPELQQALNAAQRRCEEMDEALRSRSQVLEILQQEINSADQQKQILTAQFRQMEQELADAVKQREEERQQWAEQARGADTELAAFQTRLEAIEKERTEVPWQETELASLREAQCASQEALEKERVEVASLQTELAALKEAELAAIQACNNTSERDRVEIARLGRELASKLEGESAALRDSKEALEREKPEVDKLERELAYLREEQGESQRKGEILAELWHQLHSLAVEDVYAAEESPMPADMSLFVSTMQSIEDKLTRLKYEQRESEERCAQINLSTEALQEQLERQSLEKDEAIAKIQQLEQQIGKMSEEMLPQPQMEPPARDSSENEKALVLALEQQLLEKDKELVALQECLSVAMKSSCSGIPAGENYDQEQDAVGTPHDVSTAPPEPLEDTQDGENTLVAEDTSVFSISADASSPELIEPQSESPGESKGTSSDEMVASSDSEVAHSSWTLLEAVSQDGGQEWPSVLQDFGPLQLQSWEETSMQQETSTVQVESSSVIIRETVQVQLTQQGSFSMAGDFSSGQAFAQVLAEELQKRYSELMAELQKLRETSTESQEKIQGLEEESQALVAAKLEAESQACNVAEELSSTREKLDKLSQQRHSMMEKHRVEMRLLEEQIDILNTESEVKEQKIQALQTDFEIAQKAHSEQEGQTRMLSAQLEDREFLSSELEQRLQDMENSMLEYSQTSDVNNASLSIKDSEISELQNCLAQKQQEMMELNDSMSAKLLLAEEKKVLKDSEVSKLKEQVLQLQKDQDEKGKENTEGPTGNAGDELSSLRKEKTELGTQLTNMKKKLQAALVQRKEFMKKVADLEAEAKKRKEQEETATGNIPPNIAEMETYNAQEIQQMEAKLGEVKEALRSKEETVETLEQKISQQDQLLTETLALNRTLSESSQQVDMSADLQSKVASVEAECETLQKKLLEAQEARKETNRKAKEKDRHHREQLKQQKEEYSELLERFEVQSGEREVLLHKVKDFEELQAQTKVSTETQDLPVQEITNLAKDLEKPTGSDWVQEDWVDFATSESDVSQPQCYDPIQPPAEQPEVLSPQMDITLNALRGELQTVQVAHTEVEMQLQETQTRLSLRESELMELGKELQALKEKERNIDVLSEEIKALTEKYLQAESYAKTLKAEMEAAAKDSESSITTLQAEVEDFRQFLNNKNNEITDLSRQLGEQSSLISSMQDTVSEKDQLIVSLQEELKTEQEKMQEQEKEKEEEEKGGEAKIQQLHRKLQAALISRKEALKENKTQKEKLVSTENVLAELQEKMESTADELEKLRAEKVRLIDEVDRTLLENQSLGSSCESLKLAMDGILSEKDACNREAEFAKEEVIRASKEWEEKVQNLKDEYETLLKSYENVSDEAERVRRVLEAARQERQELASRVRTHEAARQEAERRAEEAQKEVDLVKDKMRKFAKTKQQKIMELEEENETLREMQEKTGIKRGERALKTEIEKLEEEVETLKAGFDATVAQRDSLEQQMEELREKLSQAEKKIAGASLSSASVVDEVVVAQESDVLMSETLPAESQSEDKEEAEPPEEAPAEEVPAVSAEPEKVSQPPEERETVESAQIELEDKLKQMEAAMVAEGELRQQREAELKAELATLEQDLRESQEKVSLMTSLEQDLQESREREKSLTEESVKREAQVKELLKSLENEKDNLEERLMNQLAQLNGSIADYQQEAADNREHLSVLQAEVERLERERAELEVLAQSERDRGARLEEDLRQARRERAEAEAESGKQRELEQQLRSAQRVREGSQSRTRNLEELLREKQLELRQLQRDSILYQERISELCKEAKAMHISHDELNGKLEKSKLETSDTKEQLKTTEARLVSCQSELEDAQKEASQAISERATMEQNVLKREASLKAEAEQTLDSVRFRLGAELKQNELRLEESYRERDQEEEATLRVREMAEGAERRAQELQGRLDESLARLVAFSRCMSSLQDDRDRVLDEARQWETRFNSTLQGKEAEVREAEMRAKELAGRLQKESALKEDLQLSVDRLEKADKDCHLRLEEEEKKVRESQTALEEERATLQQTVADMQSAQSEALALKNQLEGVSQRARALEEAVGRLQGEVDQARAELRDREAEERRLCLNVEQLETDLRSSKALTESLQVELSEKEKREVEMLGEKEQAVAQAAEEARKEAESRAQEAEGELEQRRADLRDVEGKLRQAQEESINTKARLDSFTKAMGSLQDDRDRVLNTYKQLEEKHLQVMVEKDGLIQEAAGENNTLKEELRSLLVQRDDLYAERAQLSAQLHGYRNELNQVLSMKDSQHKQLLAAQRERIVSLEREQGELKNQLKSLSQEREVAVQAVERETLSQARAGERTLQAVDAPGAEVEKLREQLHLAREQVEALEETLNQERQQQTNRSQELAELRWEGGVMRTESENAQERVAELARDLLLVEQRLLGEKEVTTQLKSEKQSFAKTMASLQDSRDQAVSKVQELNLKVEEMSKAGVQPAHSSPAGSTGEVWGLKNALQALQNDRERLLEQLQNQTCEIQKLKSELARLGAGELIKITQELFEEKTKTGEMLGAIRQLENIVEMGKQEVETLRLERIDWMAQAEQLKQQTLATLSERDQHLRQLTAMLEEARAHTPKRLQEQYQREGSEEGVSAPGAPQERNNLQESHAYLAEVKELQQRLEYEVQQRISVEEQLTCAQDRFKRHMHTMWQSEGDHAETALFIEPPDAAVTRTRRGGPGMMRKLRVAFCSRQRTPLLCSLYLLTVHVLLLLCLGGYL